MHTDQEKWGLVYIKAFYWATTTLMVSSFGDIVPVTTKEIIVITLLEMVGLIILSFWIGVIQELLHQFRDIHRLRRKNLAVVNRLMVNNRVPNKVQREVKDEVLHMSKTVRAKEIEEQNNLVERLDPEVRKVLLEAIHTHPLTSMSLWNRLSTKAIRRIANLLDRKLYY